MKVGCLFIFIVICTVAGVYGLITEQECYWEHLCFEKETSVVEIILAIIIIPIIILSCFLFWAIIIKGMKFFGGDYNRKSTIDLKGNKFGQADFKKGCLTFILILIGIPIVGGLIMYILGLLSLL